MTPPFRFEVIKMISSDVCEQRVQRRKQRMTPPFWSKLVYPGKIQLRMTNKTAEAGTDPSERIARLVARSHGAKRQSAFSAVAFKTRVVALPHLDVHAGS